MENNLISKLLEKSQEAFILSIEIYNKPTIKYRVEGFSFFICNAWELLLKAYLLSKNESIYYGDNNARTLSIEGCIRKVLTNSHDPARQNLEKIIQLRNISTHYITEEYEAFYIPLFQSCVLNYTNKLIAYFDIDITDKLGANFLTLSVKLSDIQSSEIKARYPKEISDKLLHTKEDIDSSLPSDGNLNYAIKVVHDWAVVKQPKHATATFSIAKDAEQSTYIMKQQVDPQKQYPFRQKQCLKFINQWIEKNTIRFISPNTPDTIPSRFNSNHFELFCKFYNIKNNPDYTYAYTLNSTPNYSYSKRLLDFIKEEIKKDPEHIIQGLRHSLKK